MSTLSGHHTGTATQGYRAGDTVPRLRTVVSCSPSDAPDQPAVAATRQRAPRKANFQSQFFDRRSLRPDACDPRLFCATFSVRSPVWWSSGQFRSAWPTTSETSMSKIIFTIAALSFLLVTTLLASAHCPPGTSWVCSPGYDGKQICGCR